MLALLCQEQVDLFLLLELVVVAVLKAVVVFVELAYEVELGEEAVGVRYLPCGLTRRDQLVRLLRHVDGGEVRLNGSRRLNRSDDLALLFHF